MLVSETHGWGTSPSTIIRRCANFGALAMIWGLSCLLVATGVAFAGQSNSQWKKTTTSPAWVTNRSDKRLTLGMVLATPWRHPAQGKLALMAAAEGKLEAALAQASELRGVLTGMPLVEELMSISRELFPIGEGQASSEYTVRVKKAVRSGRALNLGKLAEEGLGTCRERAVALKLLLEQAGIEGVRLATGSLWEEQENAPPMWVRDHAWLVLPLSSGRHLVIDPSAKNGLMFETSPHVNHDPSGRPGERYLTYYQIGNYRFLLQNDFKRQLLQPNGGRGSETHS